MKALLTINKTTLLNSASHFTSPCFLRYYNLRNFSNTIKDKEVAEERFFFDKEESKIFL
jgi:hypothetical protein